MRTFSKFGFSMLFLISCLAIQPLNAQKAKDVFNADTPLTYLGIDFTEVRIVGETNNPAWEIRDKFFPTINSVIINEPKKYDLKSTFQKGNVNFNLDPVMEKNSKAKLEGMVSLNSSDDNSLDDKAIANIAKGYKFNGKKGIGLLIIMETMNKTQTRATMHFAFIDMANSKVLFAEKLSGKPRGFGFRNYWAGAVHDALGQIEKQHYMVWKNNNQ